MTRKSETWLSDSRADYQHSCRHAVALFNPKPSSRNMAALATNWYPECVPDLFQNLSNSSVVDNQRFTKFHENLRVHL